MNPYNDDHSPDFDAWMPTDDEFLFEPFSSTRNIHADPQPALVHTGHANTLSLEELTIRTREAYIEQGLASSMNCDFLRPTVSVEQPFDMTAAQGCVQRPRARTESARPKSAAFVPQRRAIGSIRPRPLSTSDIPHLETPVSMTVCWIKCHLDSDDMVFECHVPDCAGTYRRFADFKRHYDGAHAVERPEFWCPDIGCERSVPFGAPFPRRDKMMDHAFKMHGLTPSRLNSKRKRNVGAEDKDIKAIGFRKVCTEDSNARMIRDGSTWVVE